MTQSRNGPPKEVEGRAPHHRDRPSTSKFGGHATTYTHEDPTADRAETVGRQLAWVPCTRSCQQDTASQLSRRREAARRSVPLHCNCRDPWVCRCAEAPPSDATVDAGRAAAEHLLYAGCVPLLETKVLQALWRRGGDDRAFAERLHQLTGGLVA